MHKPFVRIALAIVLAAGSVAAQQTEKRVFYLPRPAQPAPWQAPMKPLVRLADLQAKHFGEPNWTEVVIADRNSFVEVIQAMPGSKVRRHLHPDSPHWWVVQKGRIRFEIEYPEGKFQTIEARKGSYVYAAERHLHSLEVIGTEPAIRMDVTLRDASPVYESPLEGYPKGGAVEFLPITLDTGLNPLDVPSTGGKPDRIHVNIEDLETAHKGQGSWSEPSMRKNRVRGNFIYGYAKNNPNRPGDRGHLHADFAEFWTVLRGKLRWDIEGVPGGPFVAEEGDIIYAPPMHFHHIEFVGDSGSCRLTSSTYPSANHFYDPPH